MSLADRISKWMTAYLRGAGARGFVVGLSGGVDSAVVAVLAQRAVQDIGKHLLGVLMPCHSIAEDADLARLLARTFDIETVTVDLAPAYDALLAALPPGSDLARANLKPRLRMTTLYYLANEREYLVAGTGNRSELMAGYFTKYGDGGVDLLPLGDLLKTQVWDLARELGVPAAIVNRAPSAGLWRGQTDEEDLGVTYAALDRTLAALERDDTSDVDPVTLTRVQELIACSTHKRVLPPIFQL